MMRESPFNPATEGAKVVDLMAALEASVAEAKKARKRHPAASRAKKRTARKKSAKKAEPKAKSA